MMEYEPHIEQRAIVCTCVNYVSILLKGRRGRQHNSTG